MRAKAIGIALAMMVPIVGCSSAPREPGFGAGTGTQEMVTETIIHLLPDGTHTTSVRKVVPGIRTAGQLPKPGTVQPDIVEEPQADCYLSSVLTLYDNYNNTGNVVCFYGAGGMSLSGITFDGTSEALTGNIHSVWAGDSPGDLYETCNGHFTCTCNFTAGQQIANAPTFCQYGTSVFLTQN